MVIQANDIVEEYEVIDVRGHLRAPAVYCFPTLEQYGDKRLGNWGWYRMDHLNLAFTQTLRSQGYSGKHGQHAPDYSSFRADFFPNHFPRPFIWVIHPNANLSIVTQVNIGHDTNTCPFQKSNLFIPTGWGVKALKLAGDGVIRLNAEDPEKANDFRGQRWDGSWMTASQINRTLRH